ncbi:MAG: hypothetical protein KA134_05075, partial [Achromobacter sp.]|nr:hypothetical protein [Achromobacter sp.]
MTESGHDDCTGYAMSIPTTFPTTFPAFRIHNDDAGYRSGIEPLSLDQLSPGEVVIKVEWSSV